MKIKNKLTTVQIDQKTHREIVKIKARLEAETGKMVNMNRVLYAMALHINKDYETNKKQLKLEI